ncbi:hypothetical protein AAFF_G00258190 [Aldrovandia affinis]|uniref:Uncharacterized protein n=1 Tax=Aldrovandia affinis TaxID=143900 RepID=A0AAD7WTG8_9TELE|nr:hypothetical protein AAFF_G00258190 [Aldrovandia affinis]
MAKRPHPRVSTRYHVSISTRKGPEEPGDDGCLDPPRALTLLLCGTVLCFRELRFSSHGQRERGKNTVSPGSCGRQQTVCELAGITPCHAERRSSPPTTRQLAGAGRAACESWLDPAHQHVRGIRQWRSGPAPWADRYSAQGSGSSAARERVAVGDTETHDARTAPRFGAWPRQR